MTRPSATLTLLALLALGNLARAEELFPGATRSPLGVKPARTTLDEFSRQGMAELKFVHGAGARLVEGQLIGTDERVSAVAAHLTARGVTVQRMWLQSDDELEARRLLGEQRSGRPLHDLTQFFQLRSDRDIGLLCDELNAFDVVELAYPIGAGGDPVHAMPVAGTPDFEALQEYKLPAPTGVDAVYGNTFSGGIATGITIADCETGWTDDHEDLSSVGPGDYVGLAPLHYPWDHGTAVLGELVGADNDLGVRGIAYGAAVKMSTHQGSSANFATAIQAAASAVGVGDAVVIEIQCSGGPPGPYPCEYIPSVYAVVEATTALGTHVFAAAGNGNRDLDAAAYGGLFDRTVRDSGAVMCGASAGVILVKASFSNYGSRLDAHGWGLDVATCAYGDLHAGAPTEEYTATFSGTSSATPIVTGAGVLLHSIYRDAYGLDLAPLDLRSVLTDTGTPLASGGYIGPRPDIRAALADLDVPRISLVGALTPGSSYEVVSQGAPGDLQVTIASASLRSVPFTIAPYGQLFLEAPLRRADTGVLDSSGEARYPATVPNDPALIGSTIAYYQGWQRFVGGGAALTNWVSVTVE